MIPHLAIVGATGAVGREFCALMAERELQVGSVSLFASKRGAGTRIAVGSEQVNVQELTDGCFSGVGHAIFSAGSECSRRWAPVAW